MASIVQTDEFFPCVGQVGEPNLSVIFLCWLCRSPPHKTATLFAVHHATISICLLCR